MKACCRTPQLEPTDIPTTATRRAVAGAGAASTARPAASGEERPTAGTTSRSLELVIPPQRHQIAIEILAQRHDLALEAPAQLGHQAFVEWLGITVEKPTPDRIDGAVAHLFGRVPFDRPLDGSRYRPATMANDAREPVEMHRAHTPCGRVDLQGLYRILVVD